jgi:hypothetical protein
MGTTAILGRLTGMVSITASAIPPAEQIEDEMQKILSSPEFSSPRDTILQKIIDWLLKLFSNILPGGERANLVAIIILVATALLLAFVIVFAVLKISRLLGRQHGRNGHLVGISPELLTPEASCKMAEEEAKSGNYSSAIRWLFINILLTLSAQSYIKINESRTNRQYLNELKRNNYPQINMFQNLVHRFNRIRYGGRKADYEDYSYWVDAVKTISGSSPKCSAFKGGDGHSKG